jgi:hypothetical protein
MSTLSNIYLATQYLLVSLSFVERSPPLHSGNVTMGFYVICCARFAYAAESHTIFIILHSEHSSSFLGEGYFLPLGLFDLVVNYLDVFLQASCKKCGKVAFGTFFVLDLVVSCLAVRRQVTLIE